MAGIADIIRKLIGGSPNLAPGANPLRRDFGMTGGELGPTTGHHGYGQSYRPNPDYMPPGSSPSMNMDWSKVRATQRPGYEREPSPYDESAITKLAEGRTVGFEDFAFPNGGKMRDVVEDNPQGLGHDYTNEGYDLGFATPNMGYDYTNEGYTDFTHMGHDYTNEGYAGLSSPVATPRPSEMGGQHASWQTPGLEQAPFVGEPFGHEPGGEEFTPSKYMARAAQPEEVGGGQGFDLLGWLNKLPSGARKREQDLATMTPGRETGFGSKRPGTTYDGSIQGGGYFTPEEYGRHYSQYGRGS